MFVSLSLSSVFNLCNLGFVQLSELGFVALLHFNLYHQIFVCFYFFALWVFVGSFNMSSSSEYSEFSGQKQARSPEKSTFSQTCSLLSQYIKEKGSFGDLTLGMTCNTEPSGTDYQILRNFLFFSFNLFFN